MGGTVGDIESQPFLEAIRQFQHDVGKENAILIHVTLIPYLKASGEMKTKPTQASVKELQRLGIWPDVLVCRSEYPVPQEMRDKIALFCNVPSENVLQNLDVDYLYEGASCHGKRASGTGSLKVSAPGRQGADLRDWIAMTEALRHPEKEVEIAIVGKYTQLHDAYLSVVEALKHGGISCHADIRFRWTDSEELTEENIEEKLGGVDGILVPGGFGSRGTEGMILAADYARREKIPYLGICLGMQMAIVAFARYVVGYHDAGSIEFHPETLHPLISLMPDQKDVENIGGTLRLGAYPCVLDEHSRSYEIYGQKEISERHRHRYEVNNDYREVLEKAGLHLAGLSPDKRIVEMVEITDHPFYIGTQAHPEFKSRPNRPHPLFAGFVKAAAQHKN